MKVPGLALALTLWLAPGAGAQATAGDQDPAPLRALSVDGGYAVRFGDGATSEGYYRFSYLGRPIRESGAPFRAASHDALLEPAPEKAGGDVPGLALHYEVSEASLSGGVLNALGVKELRLAGLESLHLRGTAALTLDDRFDQVQGAVGLETPPVRVPGLAGSGITNWIVLGANFERRDATDNDVPDANVALGTFRTFVGKGLGWRKSASVWRTAHKLERDILTLAPTLAGAQAVRARIDSIPAARRTPVQQGLLDLIGEAESEGEWRETVREFANGMADAITDQPTAALYAEWTGWVDFAESPATGRSKTLLTLSLDYWMIPGQDDLLVRFRYEFGYARATPALRRNQLLIALGVRR